MPVIIPVGFTGINYPLDHPRVGWRRMSGTVTASSAAAGFEAANANNERTDSFWRPTALTATWAIDAGTSEPVSYCGIAAHTLGSNGCTVNVQGLQGAVWVTLATATPTTDEPLLFLFASVTRAEMRVQITGSGGMPTLGVIWFGAVTEWPMPAVYSPSVSLQRAKRSSYETNTTEGGQIVGRRLVRQELRPQMEVQYLPETWINSELDAFARHAETLPFFVADKPSLYPASVAYAFCDGDVIPDRAYPLDDIANTVTLDMRAYRAT
jgi:hypothetical protein